jgi:hypothetical protein
MQANSLADQRLLGAQFAALTWSKLYSAIFVTQVWPRILCAWQSCPVTKCVNCALISVHTFPACCHA